MSRARNYKFKNKLSLRCHAEILNGRMLLPGREYPCSLRNALEIIFYSSNSWSVILASTFLSSHQDIQNMKQAYLTFLFNGFLIASFENLEGIFPMDPFLYNNVINVPCVYAHNSDFVMPVSFSE